MSAEQLNAYHRKHGHFPRARLKNGSSQTIELHITPGYALVLTYPRGTHLYIQRDALVALHEWLGKMLPLMEGEFDVPTAIAEAAEEDRILLREQRLMKRSLYGGRRRRRR